MQTALMMPFSAKQRKVLTWWRDPDTAHLDAVICDGAVRSGKTSALGLGFVIWACINFHDCDFAVCGKTRNNVRNNLMLPLCARLRALRFDIREKISQNLFIIRFAGHENRFRLFGGKDESAAALIQGMTLAGVLLDEAALMPRSFVEQALARCSVPGSKLWFSCNPDQPAHWFYREWICKAEEKHALCLHFTMDDNPALTKQIRQRYERLYAGAFYDRFVRGIWTSAHGLVYPMFRADYHIAEPPYPPERYAVSCDYGTVNPTSFGLWGKCGDCWYRIAESYYDARITGICRTDEEHYAELERLIGGRKIERIVADPSAASFIACIRAHGKYCVQPANNDVLSGIHRTADALRNGEIRFSVRCADTLREFLLYVWDEHAERDQPVKENDHAMDDIRYFVATVIGMPAENRFFAASVTRYEL